MMNRFASSVLLASLLVVLPGGLHAQDTDTTETTETTEEVTEEMISTEPEIVLSTDTEEEPLAEPIVLTPTLGTSVGELQGLINLPSTARLKEYQEDPEKPQSLFTREEIQRIFGNTEAKFIYFPEGVDPMIIPWIRQRVVAEERAAEAQVAMAAKDFDKAEEIWKDIREKYPNTKEGQEAPRQIATIIDQRAKEIAAKARAERAGAREEVVAVTPLEQLVELPQWIRQNTTGIILHEGAIVSRRVIVGNEFLKEGDVVPRFSGVQVKTIRDSEVVYVYQNKEFVQEVVGTF